MAHIINDLRIERKCTPIDHLTCSRGCQQSEKMSHGQKVNGVTLAPSPCDMRVLDAAALAAPLAGQSAIGPAGSLVADRPPVTPVAPPPAGPMALQLPCWPPCSRPRGRLTDSLAGPQLATQSTSRWREYVGKKSHHKTTRNVPYVQP